MRQARKHQSCRLDKKHARTASATHPHDMKHARIASTAHPHADKTCKDCGHPSAQTMMKPKNSTQGECSSSCSCSSFNGYYKIAAPCARETLADRCVSPVVWQGRPC